MRSLGLLFVVSLFLGSSTAFACIDTSEVREILVSGKRGITFPTTGPIVYGGGDPGFPKPMAGKTKVELAAGEYYELIGTIKGIDGRLYLKIDLKKHPWLANTRRVSCPYYPFVKDSIKSNTWLHKKVKVRVKAVGRVLLMESGDYEYEIFLDPQESPDRYVRPRNHSRCSRKCGDRSHHRDSRKLDLD